MTEIDEKGEKITKKDIFIWQFIGSASFMASSLSNLVNKFSEGTHNIKWRYGHDDRKCKLCEIADEVCNCFLKCTNVKDDLIEYKYLIKVWLIIKRKRL